jgi:hypothetical protein
VVNIRVEASRAIRGRRTDTTPSPKGIPMRGKRVIQCYLTLLRGSS